MTYLVYQGSSYHYFLVGLEKSFSTLKSERLGLYNGHDFDFIESNYNWLTALKVFWRYGDSIQQFNNFLNNMLNKFDRSV